VDDYQNTPSILAREITSFRGGQRLAYGDLTGREERDYLFDAGMGATAYADEPSGSRPDVRQGLLQFTASALNSIAHHVLAETVTRSSDELEIPKPKLFHVPTEAARRASNPALDFRDDLAQNIPGGTTIYEVLALDEAREAALLKTGAADLDELIPHAERIGTVTTESEGTAIVDPGTARSPEIAKMINHFTWQGKIFDAKNKTLVNHIGPFGMKATLAEAYIGKSLIDKKDCVVLDDSKTSLVAKHICDEIRQIAPKTHLGPVCWDTKKPFYFALQFKG